MIMPKTEREMIEDYDRGHKLEELREMCRRKNLGVSGTKRDLIRRLVEG